MHGTPQLSQRRLTVQAQGTGHLQHWKHERGGRGKAGPAESQSNGQLRADVFHAEEQGRNPFQHFSMWGLRFQRSFFFAGEEFV